MAQSKVKLDFNRRVDDWVCSAIDGGVQDFFKLLVSLPGVYPATVLEAIDRLKEAKRVTFDIAGKLAWQALNGSKIGTAPRSLMPLPHPLEYEWRFTPDGSRFLLDLAVQLAPQAAPILLLGTPSVAVEAMAMSLPHPITFIGERNAVTARVSSLAAATGAPVTTQYCTNGFPFESAAVVIVDPPWYMDFVRPMLAITAYSCKMFGFIVVSLPPEGSRSSALDDREKTLRLASRLGLELVALHPLAVPYETPFFETNALSSLGIRVDRNWRRGDLAVFRKVYEQGRTIAPITTRGARWSEIDLGRMRLFVKRENIGACGVGGLSSIVDGDILPTVSRRDPRRKRAQVWTSGNRIFASDNPELVIEAALSLSRHDKGYGPSPLWATLAERETAERVRWMLRDLAAQEAAEERSIGPTDVGNGSEDWTSRLQSFCTGFKTTISG